MKLKKIWQEYWKRHKNHPYGMCYTNHDLKKFYVNIPKCATNWGKSAMNDLGWTRADYHQLNLIKQGYEAIVILREPVDRWFSGIAEYSGRYNIKFHQNTLNELALKLLTDRVAFDEHTEEQVMFINGLNLETTTFFKFGPDLNQNFGDYVRRELGIENNLQDKPPLYGTLGFKQKTKTLFESVFTEEHYKRLKRFYELDYDLYDNVKFYKRKDI